MIEIRAGLTITRAYPALFNVSSNAIYFYIPRGGTQHVQVRMVNSSGEEVAKRSAGDQVVKRVELEPNQPARHWKQIGLMKHYIAPHGEWMADWPSPSDGQSRSGIDRFLSAAFVLDQPGDYRLFLTQRIFMPDNAGLLQPVDFEPVMINVVVSAKP